MLIFLPSCGNWDTIRAVFTVEMQAHFQAASQPVDNVQQETALSLRMRWIFLHLIKGRCPLLAHSGLFRIPPSMSAFEGKADIFPPNPHFRDESAPPACVCFRLLRVA